MVSITGPAAEIIEIMTMLGAAPDANTLGFNPLLLKVEKNKIFTSSPNIDHTGFVVGEFEVKTKGTGEMVIDVGHVLSRVKKFFSGKDVTLDYDEKAGRLTITDGTRRSSTYPPAKGDCEFMELPMKKDKKGIILFDGEKPTTKVQIEAKELQKFLPMASEAEVDWFLFHFNVNGASKGFVGDETDKTQNPMDDEIECTVKGKDAEVTYSAGFQEVIGVLKGKVQIFTTTNCPIWIVQKLKKGKVEYVIAPKIDEE